MKSLHKPLLAGLVATFALGAIAQTPPAPAAAPVRAEAQGPHGKGPHEARHQRGQQRLEKLKQKLAITPAQEGAWNQWLASMKPEKRAERPNRIAVARMTTPERLDLAAKLRADRAARMERRDAATKTFYAGLGAEQKKTFDELGIGIGGRGFGGKGGHGHGPRGHHGHPRGEGQFHGPRG